MTPLDIALAENAKLRERIGDLELENRQLKGEAATDREDTFIRVVLVGQIGVKPATARMLFCLWRARGNMVNRDHLSDAAGLYADERCSSLKTAVTAARTAAGFDIIRNVWGHGYALTPEGVAYIDGLHRRFEAGDKSVLRVKPIGSALRKIKALRAFIETRMQDNDIAID